VLLARKRRKISEAKVLKQNPALVERAAGRISSQLLSVLTEAKRVPHKQVPCEARTSTPKQMWRAKQKAPCVASGEVPTQFHLSREDKGKMLYNLALLLILASKLSQ